MEDIKRDIEKESSEHIENVKALRRVFESDDGKKALKIISDICLAGQQAYRPDMPDKHTIFRCGMQQVHLEVKELLDLDLDEYIKAREFQEEKEYKI